MSNFAVEQPEKIPDVSASELEAVPYDVVEEAETPSKNATGFRRDPRQIAAALFVVAILLVLLILVVLRCSRPAMTTAAGTTSTPNT